MGMNQGKSDRSSVVIGQLSVGGGQIERAID
jgi:hypothetical protein